MLTKTSVRQAPAKPDSKYRALRNAGSIVASAGITYVEVKSAMTPAKNPKIPTTTKIFIRSFIQITFCLLLTPKPLFSLAYTFLSIINKPATSPFNHKYKRSTYPNQTVYLYIYTSIFPTY